LRDTTLAKAGERTCEGSFDIHLTYASLTRRSLDECVLLSTD